MAKNPLITGEVRRLIADEYVNNKDSPAKVIRDLVEDRLRKQNLHHIQGWPGLSAVQKELTKIRQKNDERSLELKGLDRPWSIGTLVKYGIVPEAIPVLLKIQENRKYALKNLLTIREAKWIARLYTLTKNMRDLDYFTRFYALEERISELTGIELDTSEIDIFVPNDVGLFILSDLRKDTRLLSDNEARQVAQSLAQKLEKSTGLSVSDLSTLTSEAIFEYAKYLLIAVKSLRWLTLSKEKRQVMITRLLKWVKENEHGIAEKYPIVLIRELDSEFAKLLEVDESSARKRFESIRDFIIKREKERNDIENNPDFKHDVEKLRNKLKEAQHERSHSQEIQEQLHHRPDPGG
jgi:hypothetical protein